MSRLPCPRRFVVPLLLLLGAAPFLGGCVVYPDEYGHRHRAAYVAPAYVYGGGWHHHHDWR